MNAQADQGADHVLKRIRAVGFEETYNTSEMLDKLAELADGSYSGLNSEGLAGEDEYPVLDGTLNVHTNAYEDAVEALKSKFKRLTLNITGAFYVRFRDKDVRDICASLWGDGVGVTKSKLATVTTISSSTFQNNDKIEDFSDFAELFLNCDLIEYRAFYNCTNLKSISFPNNIVINAESFRNCPNLDFQLPIGCTLWSQCFANTGIVNLYIPKETKYTQASQFSECKKLENIILEEGCTIVTDSEFNGCKNLQNVTLPSTITDIKSGAFWGTESLQNFVIKTITPPDLGSVAFANSGTNLKIYVPDASVEAYKTATNWSAYASRIYPLSKKN